MSHNFPTKEQIDLMTTEQKIDGLRCLSVLSEEILQVAANYWASLELSGADLTGMIDDNPSFYKRVREIAHGRLSAKAYMVFGDNPSAMSVVRKLPIAMQNRMAEEQFTEIVEKDTAGRVTQRKIAIPAMSPMQVKLAFNTKTGEKRTFNEQVALLTMPPSISDREPVIVTGKIHIRGRSFWTDGKTTVDQVIRELDKRGLLDKEDN
jgi:hypothetical protein